jgi:hypothetical protein
MCHLQWRPIRLLNPVEITKHVEPVKDELFFSSLALYDPFNRSRAYDEKCDATFGSTESWA